MSADERSGWCRVAAPYPPLCMVAFLGSMAGEMMSARNAVLLQLAAHRFHRWPCACGGCRALVADLERRGKGPAALPEHVEVRS